MATGEPGEWQVVWTGGATKHRHEDIEGLLGTADLATVEDSLGIAPRTPIFVRPDFSLDPRLCEFVQRSKFRSLSPSTRESYALDLRLLLTFLHQGGADWAEATADDLDVYEHWRRRHRDNPSPVSGAKWVRERAAIKLLYGWAHDRGIVAGDPTHRLTQPKDVRSKRVRWLTPRALKLWKRVGLSGYRVDGLRDPDWASFVDDRNLAMVDLMYASGLRVQEAGSLLTLELPPTDEIRRSGMSSGFVAAACAKGHRRRQFWVTSSAMSGIESYLTTTRRSAVIDANAAGRYERIADLRVVTNYSPSTGRVTYVDRNGVEGRVNVDAVRPADRKRYFREGLDGLDPLWLWLNAFGRPVGYRTWTENVFPAANARCESQGVSVRCTPHMLRHSFALRMLVALEYAMSSRSGMTAEERRREDLLLGSPFDLVRDLLGHASTATTRNHYLEPLAGLRVEHLLGDEDEDDLQRVIARIARRSPLVQDVSSVGALL